MKPALSILGVPIHDVDFEDVCAQVAAWLEEPGSRQIATVNPEFVMAARRDPAFAAARVVLPTAAKLTLARDEAGRFSFSVKEPS